MPSFSRGFKLSHVRVASRCGVGVFVERLQNTAIGSRSSSSSVRKTREIFPGIDQQSELRAPIADMIVADDVVAEKSQSAPAHRRGPVLRMWPTCIGLATLGEPKSITIRRRVVCERQRPADRPAKAARPATRRPRGLSAKLMKPAPAIVGDSHHSPTSRCSMIFCASALGFSPRCLARTSAALVW